MMVKIEEKPKHGTVSHIVQQHTQEKKEVPYELIDENVCEQSLGSKGDVIKLMVAYTKWLGFLISNEPK